MNHRLSWAAWALVSMVAIAASTQDGPCAGKLETFPIGGSYYATGIAVSGDLLVSVDWDSLTTWDLSDPDSPVPLGQWISSAENHAYGEKELLKLDPRGFAFVSNWYTSRIEVFDLRDPAEPTPIGRFGTGWNDFDLVEDMLVGVDSHLTILDVADPFRPVPLCDSCLQLIDSGPPSYWDRTAVAISGDLVVTADFGLLKLIDISNPIRPVEVSAVDLFPFHARDIRLWAGVDRAVVWSSTGMHSIDFSNPDDPMANFMDVDVYFEPYWGEIHQQNLVIDEIGSFAVVDISELGGEVVVDRVDRYAPSSEVVGNRLYIGTSSGIEAFDLSVRPIEQLGIGIKDQATHIVIDGDTAIATGSRTVRSLAYGPEGRPSVVHRLELDDSVGRPAIDGSLVAASLYPPAVALLAMDPGLQLEIIGEISTGDCQAYQVALDRGRLAIPAVCEDESGVLDVYDVSNPGDPTLEFRYVTDEPVVAAAFEGNRLFVTRGGDLLEFDVSDPPITGPPVVLPVSEDAGRIYSLAFAGDCLFVGTSGALLQAGDNFLAAVDVDQPGNPVLLAKAEFDSFAPFWLAGSNGVAAGGEYWNLYLTTCPLPGEELEVSTFQFSRSVTRGGGFRDGKLVLAARHSVDELDLACVQPEADFRWYTLGTWVQFEDRTTYLDGMDWSSGTYDRKWRWVFSNGRTWEGLQSPLIDFELPGVYTATLEVTTEMGTSSVTKTIEIPRQAGLSPDNRQSGGRVQP